MKVGIENLKEGMILDEDIYIGSTQIPLLTKGEELDERKINHLSRVPDLNEVYISFSKVRETIPKNLKENALMALKTRDTELTIGCAKRKMRRKKASFCGVYILHPSIWNYI